MGMIGATLRIALFGLSVGLALAALLGRSFVGGPAPFIPVFNARAYLMGTGIVLTATVMAALLPSLRAAH
jgi:hypothetical protein